jgi:hypothetical protein
MPATTARRFDSPRIEQLGSLAQRRIALECVLELPPQRFQNRERRRGISPEKCEVPDLR